MKERGTREYESEIEKEEDMTGQEIRERWTYKYAAEVSIQAEFVAQVSDFFAWLRQVYDTELAHAEKDQED
jgi:hypothetical protein